MKALQQKILKFWIQYVAWPEVRKFKIILCRHFTYNIRNINQKIILVIVETCQCAVPGLVRLLAGTCLITRDLWALTTRNIMKKWKQITQKKRRVAAKTISVPRSTASVLASVHAGPQNASSRVSGAIWTPQKGNEKVSRRMLACFMLRKRRSLRWGNWNWSSYHVVVWLTSAALT